MESDKKGNLLTENEGTRVVINKVIRNDELRLTRRDWEYLRRSPDYRADYNRLPHPQSVISIGEDIKAHQEFCQRWKIQYPFDHRLSFDQIIYLWRTYEYLPFPQRFQQAVELVRKDVRIRRTFVVGEY